MHLKGIRFELVGNRKEKKKKGRKQRNTGRKPNWTLKVA
jgi:hypothetical protein